MTDIELIDQRIKSVAEKSQYGVGPIQTHTHNGIDSLPVDAGNITNLNAPRINRVFSVTSTATPSPIVTNTDLFNITAQGGTAAFQAPAGLPLYDGQIMRIRVTSASASAPVNLTWASSTGGYTGTNLPSTTTTGQTLMLGFQLDTNNSRNIWRLFESASA